MLQYPTPSTLPIALSRTVCAAKPQNLHGSSPMSMTRSFRHSPTPQMPLIYIWLSYMGHRNENPLLVQEGLLKLCLVGFYGSGNINLRNRTRHFQLEQCTTAKSNSLYMSVVLRLWLTGVISNQGLVPYQKDKPESQCCRALCYVLYRCFYTEQW